MMEEMLHSRNPFFKVMAPFKLFCFQLLWATVSRHCTIFHPRQSPHQRNLLFINQNILFETLFLVDVFLFSINRIIIFCVWHSQVCLAPGWMTCRGQMAIYCVKQSARKLAASVAWWPKSASSLQGHLFFSPTDFCRHGNCPTSRMETKANSLLPALIQRGNT